MRQLPALAAIAALTVASKLGASAASVLVDRSLDAAQSLSIRTYSNYETESELVLALGGGEDILAWVPHYDGYATIAAKEQYRAAAPSSSHLVWVTREVVDGRLERQQGPHSRDWPSLLFETISAAQVTAETEQASLASAGEYADVSGALPLHLSPRILSFHDSSSALLEVPSALLPALDLYLPRFTQSFLLPALDEDNAARNLVKQNSSPHSLSQDDAYKFPTPQLHSFVSTLLRTPHLEVSSLNKTALTLSGEEQSDVPESARWQSRHSATWGNRKAGEWILGQMRDALRGVSGARCEIEDFKVGFGPNIVCVLPAQKGAKEDAIRPFGDGDEDDDDDRSASASASASSEHLEPGAVLLSAHYDSRGSFGNPLAPGANDDGSGSTMLLGVGRALGQAISEQDASRRRRGLGPVRRREVQLVFFAGEEQGLVGSKAYAADLAAALHADPPVLTVGRAGLYRSTQLRLALQTDMIAYHAAGLDLLGAGTATAAGKARGIDEPYPSDEPLQIAFPDKLSTPSATSYLWRTASLYVPHLVPGYTPACCSDHQSFWEVGYPSTWVFERNGPILDPRYHDSDDKVARFGYDFVQVQSIGRVVLAGAAGLIWE